MRRRRGILKAALAALVLTVTATAPVAAQDRVLLQSPVLVIEFDRVFAQSAYGRAAQEMLEREAGALNVENRRIEAELSAEEQALTDARDGMTAEEFRPKAEAFDAKVQAIRAERLEKARALEQRQGEIRRTFQRAAAPILERMMVEAGAVVILEQGTVLIARNAIDITEEAISRIDAAGLMPEGATTGQP